MAAARKKPALKTGPTAASAVSASETEALLALAVPPVPPPAHVKKALLARIQLDQLLVAPDAAPAGWRFESAREEQGWRAGAFPGVRFKTLSVDETRDLAMVLIEMSPGARFPDHVHDLGGDEGIVISGDVITAGRLMRAGDYYCAAEGTSHVGTVSPSGCVALVNLTCRAWKQWRSVMAG